MILQDIINTLSLPEFYFAVFRSATPVLLTTLGAMIASRSGTNNIALEGTMLISAFVGVVVSAFTQSAWIGFFGAVLAGFLISNILAYFILKLNSNSVISGIALNTFASGGTIFALYLLTGEKGASTSLASLKLPSIDIPVIQDIPVIGAILSGHHVLTYAALILVAVIWYMFKYTELGMHIRAVGESPDAAESVGIHVKRVKYTALSLSGILTGMAGAFLSMGYVGLFSAGMTAGRGYIALATQAIAAGNAVMVDVSVKPVTTREAIAHGIITMNAEAFAAVQSGTVKKGDVLGVARIAGIMATKRTSELIPLCHPLPLSKLTVDFHLLPEQQAVEAVCTVRTIGVTGVEMEALTGVSAALLTIYDMCKAVDKGMELGEIHLVEKTGGKSGHYVRAEGGYV